MPGRVCASVWHEGSKPRKWDGKEETAPVIPSVSVELLGGSSQPGVLLWSGSGDMRGEGTRMGADREWGWKR